MAELLGWKMAPMVVLMVMLALLVVNTMSNPLDDYVQMPDDHYAYRSLKTVRKDKYTLHILNMTSQKWMDGNFTNRPIWWHYVYIVVPKNITVKDTAFMFVGEGHNTDPPKVSNEFVDLMILLAVSSQTVSAIIMQVPNQPIKFKSDRTQTRRTEDNLLAWSWKEYLNDTKHPYTLVHLAMTKAVVRAMDTVDSYSQRIRKQKIDKFFVAGASKRGWTTWLTAAVDKRVIGMAPIVFDLLNIDKALHGHYKSLGGWTFAFKAYFKANITRQLDSNNLHQSETIIDPLVYKARYTMPTFIVKASGDEFFLPDETKFFLKNLTAGPTYLRVLPNCEHSTIGQITNLFLSLRSFYQQVLHRAPFPKVSWVMKADKTGGSIRVSMDRKPLEVNVYHARTLRDGRRDFRLFIRNPKTGGKLFHPVFWLKEKAVRLAQTEYEAKIEAPEKGWGAFFIEMTFAGASGSTLAFSTEVNIVPNNYPFPECHGKNCTGTLV